MEVTLLDSNDNRYDPELIDIERNLDRDLLVVQHDHPVSFSRGDRADIILASDRYEDSDPSDIVKQRKQIRTVTGHCEASISDQLSCWGVIHTAAVTDVLEADSRLSITDFD